MNAHLTRLLYVLRYMSCVLPAFIFTGSNIHAQKTDSCFAGVYVTQEDFIHNRISNKINPAEKGYKFSFNFPADLTLTLKITTPDSTFKFPPGSIYGYNECGKIYRFFPGGKELTAQEDFYKIEEAEKGLVIYSSVFVSNGEIFYSMELNSPIHRLILKNLERDFEPYPEFISKAKKLKGGPDGIPARDENGFRIMKFYREIVMDE